MMTGGAGFHRSYDGRHGFRVMGRTDLLPIPLARPGAERQEEAIGRGERAGPMSRYFRKPDL